MTDTQSQDPDLKFAIDLAQLAEQTRCHNIVLLDVRQKSPVTKYFLIATGTSDRQRRTVGDELIALGKQSGFPAWRSNGYETAKWIVIDFVDVVAHVFEEASREFYDLEMLWGDCPRVQWQTRKPEIPAPAVTPPETVISPAEIAVDIPPAAIAAQEPAAAAGEPEVEEFVDEQLFIANVTDNGEIVEATSVEVIAVAAAESAAPASQKITRTVRIKPAAKTAGKSKRVVAVKVMAKAKSKAKAKAAAKVPSRRSPAVKLSAAKATKPKASPGGGTKAKKPVRKMASVKKISKAKSAVKKAVTKKSRAAAKTPKAAANKKKKG